MAKKKSHDHLFADEESTPVESEFAALLDGAVPQRQSFAPGDRLRGEVVAVTAEEAFVSTGTAVDATMPYVVSPDQPAPQIGDTVDVVVVRVRDGEILVKRQGASGVGLEVDSLEDAFRMEIPLEGTVLEVVKGGFRVKVQSMKAFCPISQMDLRVERAEDYVGKKFRFLITKYERGRDLVVSRRKLLQAERSISESVFLSQAKVDDILTGKVFRLEKYGAFVRLDNGVEGLIPISETSWSRIQHPHDVLNLDQVVQVKVMRIGQEEGRLRLSLSLKQGGSVVDPWASVLAQFPIGSQVEGVVENRESFGLFVNIASGVTGLLPRSAWRDSTDAKQYENKRRGEKLLVQVQSVDVESRKLSFALPGEVVDESWRQHGGTSSGKGVGMGTMADLLKNVKVRS